LICFIRVESRISFQGSSSDMFVVSKAEISDTHSKYRRISQVSLSQRRQQMPCGCKFLRHLPELATVSFFYSNNRWRPNDPPLSFTEIISFQSLLSGLLCVRELVRKSANHLLTLSSTTESVVDHEVRAISTRDSSSLIVAGFFVLRIPKIPSVIQRSECT
jgi:hypothetical protein